MTTAEDLKSYITKRAVTATLIIFAIIFAIPTVRTVVNTANLKKADQRSCERALANAKQHNKLIDTIEVGVRNGPGTPAQRAVKLARYDAARTTIHQC